MRTNRQASRVAFFFSFFPNSLYLYKTWINSRQISDERRTWTGPLSNALHRKFFVINIIMTYCALAAHLCFMQTIVLSPYMTTFMALATNYGRRMTKCVLTATRTSELNVSKTGIGFYQTCGQIRQANKLKKINKF